MLGPLDEAAGANLLELAAAAATACAAVRIHLDHVESMSQEAVALLLFQDATGRAQSEKITLRASGRPGRQAGGELGVHHDNTKDGTTIWVSLSASSAHSRTRDVGVGGRAASAARPASP